MGKKKGRNTSQNIIQTAAKQDSAATATDSALHDQHAMGCDCENKSTPSSSSTDTGANVMTAVSGTTGVHSASNKKDSTASTKPLHNETKSIVPPKLMPNNVRSQTLSAATEIINLCMTLPGEQLGWQQYLHVHQKVEEIRRKQEKYVMTHLKREEAMPAFVKWLTENGSVNMSHVALADVGQAGWGLIAKRDILQYEKFLTIPRKFMMTTQNASESCLKDVIERDRILSLMPNIVLALFLLCEKATGSSFWAPYINSLPHSYTLPLYFTLDDVILLKDSPMFLDVLHQYRNTVRQYFHFFKFFSENSVALPIKSFTFDDYRWAVATVMSRQNQIPADQGNSLVMALIPLWDMCNHRNGEITTDYSIEDHSCVCYAANHFKAGGEIFICYGNRPSSDFFMQSGFVYEDNQEDYIPLTDISMAKTVSAEVTRMRVKLALRVELNTSGPFYFRSGWSPAVDSDLLTYARIGNMTTDELLRHLTESSSSSELLKQLHSKDLLIRESFEENAWLFLELKALKQLKVLTGSLARLNSATHSDSIHHAMIVKLLNCEKKILENAASYCKNQRSQLKVLQKSIAEELVTTNANVKPDLENEMERIDDNIPEGHGAGMRNVMEDQSAANELIESNSTRSNHVAIGSVGSGNSTGINIVEGINPGNLKDLGLSVDKTPATNDSELLVDQTPATKDIGLLVDQTHATEDLGVLVDQAPATKDLGLLVDQAPATEDLELLVDHIPATKDLGLMVDQTPATKDLGLLVDQTHATKDLVVDQTPAPVENTTSIYPLTASFEISEIAIDNGVENISLSGGDHVSLSHDRENLGSDISSNEIKKSGAGGDAS